VAVLTEVVLHGYLVEAFGESFRFKARRPYEVMKALQANFAHFRETVRDGQFWIRVVSPDGKSETYLGPDELDTPIKGTLHVIPVEAGANRASIIKIVVGILLIAASFWNPMAAYGIQIGTTVTSFATISATVGLSLVVQGVAGLLIKPAELEDDGDGTQSTLFDGPQNYAADGLPVPVLMGEMVVGSVVIAEEITTAQRAHARDNGDGTFDFGFFGAF
jgi:predicted phage tail protein